MIFGHYAIRPSTPHRYHSRPKTSLRQISSALYRISPDVGRDQWFRVGAAIKSELGDDGYQLFRDWSAGSYKFDEKDCRATWRSIKADRGIGIGTLFWIAKNGGTA